MKNSEYSMKADPSQNQSNRLRQPAPSKTQNNSQPTITVSSVTSDPNSKAINTRVNAGGINAWPKKPGWFSRLIGKLRRPSKARTVLEDALAVVTVNSDGFSAEEKTLLNNVLRLHDIRVEDVMIARAEMEAVDISTTLGDLLLLFESSGHSRMPVFAETLDDPRGMVHIRDVVAHITRTALVSRSKSAKSRNGSYANLDIKKVNLEQNIVDLKLVRDVLFVPPSMQASGLMEKMQASRIQMALVIDEYGGTDGLVSLEDLMEVIVGDIEDEHDVGDENLIRDQGEGVFLCDARADLEDLAEVLGSGFQPGELAEDVDTIGGLVFEITGRIPVRGEVIEALGYEFRVIEADPRRLCSVEIAPAIKSTSKKTARLH